MNTMQTWWPSFSHQWHSQPEQFISFRFTKITMCSAHNSCDACFMGVYDENRLLPPSCLLHWRNLYVRWSLQWHIRCLRCEVKRQLYLTWLKGWEVQLENNNFHRKGIYEPLSINLWVQFFVVVVVNLQRLFEQCQVAPTSNTDICSFGQAKRRLLRPSMLNAQLEQLPGSSGMLYNVNMYF